jgi:glutaredoxin 2
MTLPVDRPNLALYHYDACPYCYVVRSEIERLGVDVELRNIHLDSRHRTDLVAARGRATVPVLRITSANEDRWMPESRDIVQWLRKHYARD